jgi:hypothetical protein
MLMLMLMLFVDLVYAPKYVRIIIFYNHAHYAYFFSWITNTGELDCQIRQITTLTAFFQTVFWQCGEIVNNLVIYEQFQKWEA